MRSARYFAADHGVKYARLCLSQRNLRAIDFPRSPQKCVCRLPSRQIQPNSGDEKVNEEAEAAEGDAQSRSSRDQRVKPDWYVAYTSSATFGFERCEKSMKSPVA